MAASILSQDLLSICLLISGGDLELSLEEMIILIEEFQEINDRHFGISRCDFRNLFNNLIYSELELQRNCEELKDIKLKDVTSEILSFFDAHFNDEGEHWTKDILVKKNKTDSMFIEYWYSYNEKEYEKNQKVKKEMIEFFRRRKINKISPGKVKEFLNNLSVTPDLLYSCSRPSLSS